MPDISFGSSSGEHSKVGREAWKQRSALFAQVFRPLVHRFAQRLARLEMRHAVFRDVHAFAGTGIASHARRPAVDREAAEAADLDAVPAHERIAHRVQDGLDGVLGVAVRQLTETGGQFFDEVRSCHGRSPVGVERSAPGGKDPARRRTLDAGRAYCLSWSFSLARRSAPRLVVPACSREDCCDSCAIAPCSSTMSFCLMDSWMLRVLRSMFTTTAETSSPSFSTLRASSTRSRLISEARR